MATEKKTTATVKPVAKAAVAKAEAAKEAKANDHSDDPEAAEIDALVKERTEAKKAKDFARADAIRDHYSEADEVEIGLVGGEKDDIPTEVIE